MSGYRTMIGMGVALAIGLYQEFVGPIPPIDPQTWGWVVPLAALVLRLITRGPVGWKR